MLEVLPRVRLQGEEKGMRDWSLRLRLRLGTSLFSDTRDVVELSDIAILLRDAVKTPLGKTDRWRSRGQGSIQVCLRRPETCPALIPNRY